MEPGGLVRAPAVSGRLFTGPQSIIHNNKRRQILLKKYKFPGLDGLTGLHSDRVMENPVPFPTQFSPQFSTSFPLLFLLLFPLIFSSHFSSFLSRFLAHYSLPVGQDGAAPAADGGEALLAPQVGW